MALLAMVISTDHRAGKRLERPFIMRTLHSPLILILFALTLGAEDQARQAEAILESLGRPVGLVHLPRCGDGGLGLGVEISERKRVDLFKANILKDEEVILEDLDVWVDVHDDGVLKSWDGHFALDQPSPCDLMSGNLRIVLDDGRSGELFVTRINTGADFSEINVDFQGTGPLE